MFAPRTNTAQQINPSLFKNDATGFIQPKLTFGKANDLYENEADRAADQIVNRSKQNSAPFLAPSSTVQKKPDEEQTQIQEKPVVSGITPLVQKKCASCEEKEKVQKKESESEEIPIQQKTTTPIVIQAKCGCDDKNNSIQKKEDFESKLNGSKGKGKKLDENTQQEMESGFGADFSQVNIHDDGQAAEMSHEIGAQAFTNGNDIYFNQGKYNPNSDSGKHLLAHELTHTIQQGNSNSIQKKDYDTRAECVKEARKKIGADKDTVAKDAIGLKISPSKNSACAVLIVIHNDEQNALKTAEVLHQFCSYNLVLLNNKNWADRRIIFPNQGCMKLGESEKYRINTEDPNSMFSKDIAQKYLYDGGNKQIGKDMKAAENSKNKAKIKAYAQMQFFKKMKIASNNFSLPVIALHNNSISDTKKYMKKIKEDDTLTDNFSGKEIDKTSKKIDKASKKKGEDQLTKMKSVLKKALGENAYKKMVEKSGKTNIYRWCNSSDLIKCHIGLPEDPDKVIWVTNESDYNKMKEKKINVVLESPKLKEDDKKSESSGDLSTLFVILKKTISKKMAEEQAEGAVNYKQEAAEVLTLIDQIMTLENAFELLALPVEAILLAHKIFELLVTGLGLGLNSIQREAEMAKLRYINIETPIDKIKHQTDEGRIESYNYIKESLQAVGLFCCGDTPEMLKKNDRKMKEKLKLEKKKK